MTKLIPVENEPEKSIFGLLSDTVVEEKDIVSPTGAKWDAEK